MQRRVKLWKTSLKGYFEDNEEFRVATQELTKWNITPFLSCQIWRTNHDQGKKSRGRNSLVVMFAKHKKVFHNLFKTISSQTTIWINVILIICYTFILNINWSFLEYFWLYFHYQVFIYCICVLAII